ncbi:hypothetical protein ACJ41O_011797 [Fusarium nematophilum]
MPAVPAKEFNAEAFNTVTKKDFDNLSRRLSHQIQSRLCQALDVIDAKMRDVVDAMDRLTQEFALILPNPPTLELPVIQYRLELDRDAHLVREMTQAGILAEFRREGGIWEHIIQARMPPSPASLQGSLGSSSAYRPCLKLVVGSPKAEEEIRENAAEISRILGLSANCRAVPPEYLVQVVGFFRENGDDGSQYAALVGAATKTDVKRSFWTRGKLVLSLTCCDHARRLCDEGVMIHDLKFKAVYEPPPPPSLSKLVHLSRRTLTDLLCVPRGYDRRSTVKLCYRCFAPGHLKDECESDDFRCGRCAGAHDIRTCPRGTPAKCCNCGEDHEAWSDKCKDPAIEKQRRISARYAGHGPAWANPSTPPSSDTSGDTPGTEATTRRQTPDVSGGESLGDGDASSIYVSFVSDMSESTTAALFQQNLFGQNPPATSPPASKSIRDHGALSPPQTPEKRKGTRRLAARPRRGVSAASDESDEEYNPVPRKTRGKGKGKGKGKGQGGKGGGSSNDNDNDNDINKTQQPVARRSGRLRGSKNEKK